MGTLMKSISGIRGIIGDGLNPINLVEFVSSFAAYCKNGKIIVGRDSRITGHYLNDLVCGTLVACGCEVIDLGIVPTPTVQIYVEDLNASGGIVITASHNPNEWNALKLLNKSGTFLTPNEAKEFFKVVDLKIDNFKKWNEIGKEEKIQNAWNCHLDKIFKLDLLNIELIKKRKFKILLDCVNGAGIEVVPELLKRLNCEVTTINCEPSGVFPRNPEPVPENLSDTLNIVKKGYFDLGIVVDPDVDRLVLITEKGDPFIEENTIALATKFVLSKKSGPVCVNLSTTKAVEDIANSFNVPFFRTSVGEINVVQKMKEVNAIIGGEGSGGVIFPELHFGRDALVGIIFTLQYLAEVNLSLSEVKDKLPKYTILKEKFDLQKVDVNSIFEKIKKYYGKCELNFEDGLRVSNQDFWFHCRLSNTEPIIRIVAETSSEQSTNQIINELRNVIFD